jgi:hypothetical protein
MPLTRFPKLRGDTQDADPKRAIALLTRQVDALSARLDAVVSAVMSTPMGGGDAPPWVNLQPENGFANNGGTGEGPFRFHKDALGYVHVTGTLVNSSGGGISANTLISTLPLGARPGAIHRCAVAASGGSIDEAEFDVDGSIYTLGSVANGATLDFCSSFLAGG